MSCILDRILLRTLNLFIIKNMDVGGILNWYSIDSILLPLQTFGNVYDNTYNCQFPRDIRQEGRFYEIGKDDLTLAVTGSTPFYRINKRNIRIVNRDGRTAVPVETKKAVKGKKKVESLPQPQLAVVPDQIFEVNECVICMSCVPNIIFLPCAHLCSCGDCFKMMQSKGNDCPMCRRRITGTIPKP